MLKKCSVHIEASEEDLSNNNAMVEKANIDYAAVGDKIRGYGLGYRHLQVLLMFAVAAILYLIRAGMSVAIIAMTDVTKGGLIGVDVYDWDKKTQDFVLSSFFWGYAVNQIPGAQIAHKYGAKILLLGALLSNALLCIMLPYIVYFGGWKAACASRVLQGLAQAPLFPCIHTLLSKWIPLNERSRLGNFVMSGGSFGTLLSMPLTGFLSAEYGWPVMFQILGAASLLIAIIWFFYCADRPAKHPRICLEERSFIESSIGHVERRKALKTPWMSIVTSRPVLALLITHVGMNWCFLTMLLETPSYLNKVLGVSMEDSGLYTSIPYIAMWIFGFIISFIADYLISKKYLSVAATRKMCTTITAWGYGFGLIALSFMTKEQFVLAIVFVTISIGLGSGMVSGIMLNHLELAPNFSGILMGITNSLANAFANFAPIGVGYILKDPTDPDQWKTVFYTTAAIAFISNLSFQIFGTSDKQPWNEPLENHNSADIEMKHTIRNGDANKKEPV